MKQVRVVPKPPLCSAMPDSKPIMYQGKEINTVSDLIENFKLYNR